MAISLLSDPDARNDPPRPLLEHLLALRDMLVFGAVAWAVCAVIAGCCTPWILEWLKSPAGESEAIQRPFASCTPMTSRPPNTAEPTGSRLTKFEAARKASSSATGAAEANAVARSAATNDKGCIAFM